LIEVLTPASQRVTPRCPHYTFCGGCHYQHISYDGQLAHKIAILEEQLQRLGGLDNVPIQPPIPSPQPWNYRNHVQFHLTPQGKLGYLKPRSDDVLQIQECHLPEVVLNKVWPLLDLEPIPGLQRIGLRLGYGDEVMLVLESLDINPPEALVEDLPVSIVHLSPAGTLVIAGSDHLQMKILNHTFHVSAASFFQINTLVVEKMVDHLIANLPLTGNTSIVELYCGVGLFSAFLAPKVKQLVGVESSPTACDDFVTNLDEYDNVVLYEAPAEEVLPQLNINPDILLADPPRTGLHTRVLEAILKLQPPLLAYISCDPSTLSRDARRLEEGGYQLKQITPFDLFPQTYHIESLSIWECGSKATL
jgi:23S rRNA (uracil1939-C5)-methyltransferase